MITINPEGFDLFDRATVERLLSFTATTLERFAKLKSPRDCIVNYHNLNPMCSNMEDLRIINLNIKGDCWGQWVYQFAHEYCHHLIDGPMTAELCGQMWFEETLCELASRFVLALSANENISQQEGFHNAFPILLDYHTRYLPLDSDLLKQYQEAKSVRPWLQLLETPEYHRQHYSVIAQQILPLFLDCPGLWQIIGLIGDSKSYISLAELLSRLKSTASPDYSEALKTLEQMLLQPRERPQNYFLGS